MLSLPVIMVFLCCAVEAVKALQDTPFKIRYGLNILKVQIGSYSCGLRELTPLVNAYWYYSFPIQH